MAQVCTRVSALLVATALAVGAVALLGLALGGLAADVAPGEVVRTAQTHRLGLALALARALLAKAEEPVPLALGHLSTPSKEADAQFTRGT